LVRKLVRNKLGDDVETGMKDRPTETA